MTLLLRASDVRTVLSMEIAVAEVERAFAAHGRGETIMPPKVYLPLPAHHGDFRAMPAYMSEGGGAAGVKWVNAHPQNPARHGLPTVRALYVLSDPETASPLAVMDGTLLTAARTGAASAVASRHLARKGARTLGVVGCGAQARWIVLAHRVVLPSIEVLCADVDATAAARFAAEIGGRAVDTRTAAGCDVLTTATPSRRPVVERDWIAAGAHVNALGADAPGKQELDPRILVDGRVFLDDVHQGSESGEVNVPLHDGTLARSAIAGTLGEVIAGTLAGRTDDAAITVFDSTGLAVQDLALARALVAAARARGLGVDVDFAG